MGDTVPAYTGKGKATIIPMGQTAGPYGNDPNVHKVVPDARPLKA